MRFFGVTGSGEFNSRYCKNRTDFQHLQHRFDWDHLDLDSVYSRLYSPTGVWYKWNQISNTANTTHLTPPFLKALFDFNIIQLQMSYIVSTLNRENTDT